jgi:tetratricopeptide (TPR) repeat protein
MQLRPAKTNGELPGVPGVPGLQGLPGLPGAARGGLFSATEDRRAVLLHIILLVLVVTAAHSTSFQGVWHYDDEHAIQGNTELRDVGAWVKRLGTSYRSLTMLSFSLTYQFSGLEPWGYHAVNLVIHALATVFLYLWLRTALPPPHRTAAFFIAALFGVHPMTTQAVVYITQRLTSMCGMFFFASLWLWGLFRLRGSWRWLVLSLLAAVLAMLCKEYAMAIPAAILAADLTIYRESAARAQPPLLRRWLPCALALATVPVVPMGIYFGLTEADGRTLTNVFDWAVRSPTVTREMYFLSQTNIIVLIYLRLILFPVGLNIDHAHQRVTSLFEGPTLISSLILVVLLGASVYAAFVHERRRGPAPLVRLAGFAGLLFFIALAPTSSLVRNTEFVQEHRTYVSLAGVLTVIVLALNRLIRPRAAQLAVYVPLIALLAGLTFARNRLWASPHDLWSDALAKNPGSSRSMTNLAKALSEMDRLEESVALYEKALAIKPTEYVAHSNLGTVLVRLGRNEDAIPHYQEAIQLNPQYFRAHNNLGNALVRRGQVQEAIPYYEEAMRLKPDFPDAWANRGMAYSRLGELEKAIADLQRAIELDPQQADAYSNLGNVLSAQGKTDEAIAHYEHALRVRPRFAEAHNNLAGVLIELGRIDEGIRHLIEAVRLKPVYGDATSNLIIAMARSGRIEELIAGAAAEDRAILEPLRVRAYIQLGARHLGADLLAEAEAAYRYAARLEPGNAAAHFGLAVALDRAGRPAEALEAYRHVVRLAPDTTEGRQAQQRIAELTGGSAMRGSGGGDNRQHDVQQDACAQQNQQDDEQGLVEDGRLVPEAV